VEATLDGKRTSYYIHVTKTVDIHVIASSGVGMIEPVYEAFVGGVLRVSTFPHKTYTVSEIKEYSIGRGMG
jgi:imidazole glycerol phosphate synthase subunit HisF